jgi:hypothetical protein
MDTVLFMLKAITQEAAALASLALFIAMIAIWTQVLMLAYVMSEGRLFALNPSDWAMLLIGVTLCGFGTLLF